MKRLSMILVGFLVTAANVNAGDPGWKQTADFVRKLQVGSGGFMAAPRQPDLAPITNLRTTSAGVRALHYLGSEIPDKAACIKYVEACYDAKSGGFSELPGGKPDVFTTAVGLMAVTELKLPTEKYAAGAVKYLTDNAKTFEDIRIAAAGLEAIKEKSPKNNAWIREVRLQQLNDETVGKDPGQARANASSVVTLLRLGAKIGDRDSVIEVLNKGQRQNGGYGKDDSPIASDLETTYRVMRCYKMLKAQPKSVEGIRSFVAKCRNEDGGYGLAPGQPSTVNGVYFAAIITHWLKQ